MAANYRKAYSSKKNNRPAGRKKTARRLSGGWIAAIAGLVGLVVLVVVLVVNGGGGSVGPLEGLRTYPNLDRGHTTLSVNYAQTPPVGGYHFAAWQNCGVYTEPVTNENAVHSLEHGAIWITYQPDLAQEELQKLQKLTRQSGYRLLSPYPDLPAPIVASAWGFQISLEQADDPRLLRFIEIYEQNPLGPEPGAACTGGVGQPG